MDGKCADQIGKAIGAAEILVAGLIDPFTSILLACGTFLFGTGIIAVAISTRGSGSGDR